MCLALGHINLPIVALDVLRIGEVLLRIKEIVRHLCTVAAWRLVTFTKAQYPVPVKAPYLGSDFAWKVGRVEAGDCAEGGDAIKAVAEELFMANAAATDNTQASDDDPFLFCVELRGARGSAGG